MKLFLLACCVSLSLMVDAQNFQWDNQQSIPEPTVNTTTSQDEEIGMALVYPDYYQGNPTALGENYYHNLLTGAHPKLPLGTMVKVTRLDNGLTTTVRINDRGAYCDDCVIDLSKAAAQQIKLSENGRTKVMLTIIDQKEQEPEPLVNRVAAPAPNRLQVEQTQMTAKGGAPIVPNEYNYINPSTQTSASTAEPRFTAKGGAIQEYKPEVLPTSSSLESDADIVLLQGSMPLNFTPIPGEVNVINQPISTFSVQLGSYSKLSNAERHILKLEEAGFNNVFLLKEKKADGSILNRVIVAPFESLDDAMDYQDDLSEYHEMKSLILQAGM